MLMEQINVMGFWSRFDEVRNTTLEQVADNIGMNRGSLRNLHYTRKLPNLADTVCIADYLNVSLDWLVLGKVVDSGNEKVSKLLSAYLSSDEATRTVINRLLNI